MPECLSNRKHEMLEELNIILCAIALCVFMCVCMYKAYPGKYKR